MAPKSPMSPVTAPGDRPFRLSMLIYDRKFRSLTFQTLVFIIVMLFAAWLVNNTVQNLARQGKTFDFGFLWNRAGYDIPFHIIPYSSADTHLRAAMVGLTNTLLVSALGCVLATIIGVLVGVLTATVGFARRVAHVVTVERQPPPDDAAAVTYRVRGDLFFASSNDLHTQFAYAEDPATVVIDFRESHIWDASAVAAVDAVTTRYQARGTAVEIRGLDLPSRRMRARLSGTL